MRQFHMKFGMLKSGTAAINQVLEMLGKNQGQNLMGKEITIHSKT